MAIDVYELENSKLNYRVKVTNAVCTITALFYSITTLFYSLWPCLGQPDESKYEQADRLTTSIVFFVLGSAFFFIGATINHQLRKHFPHFYHSFKC